jgi:DNA-binding phage protein
MLDKWAYFFKHAEGREEGMKAVALKMLERNRPLSEIMEDTGLSKEEISALL